MGLQKKNWSSGVVCNSLLGWGRAYKTVVQPVQALQNQQYPIFMFSCQVCLYLFLIATVIYMVTAQKHVNAYFMKTLYLTSNGVNQNCVPFFFALKCWCSQKYFAAMLNF